MHQSLQVGTFHIEHVIPLSRGGSSTSTNLALACPGCNLLKSDDVTAINPKTGRYVRLFNPRKDVWIEHFRFAGFRIVALSSIGRATLQHLALNSSRRIKIRRAEAQFGLFPPT